MGYKGERAAVVMDYLITFVAKVEALQVAGLGELRVRLMEASRRWDGEAGVAVLQAAVRLVDQEIAER